MPSDAQRRAAQQERGLAHRLGGKRQPASGATPWRKHDVRLEDFLVEAKRTDRGSYSIKAKEWEVLRQHAYLDGRRPMLHIELGKRRLVVLEEDDL